MITTVYFHSISKEIFRKVIFNVLCKKISIRLRLKKPMCVFLL